MELLLTPIQLPDLQLQYIIRNKKKCFRIISTPVDKLFIDQLSKGTIRAQIWIEREVRKGSGGSIKRSWVHSKDFSNKAPKKLFTASQYNYGGGLGWGWNTKKQLPTYSTTNGFVPTEFEISPDDIRNNMIIKEINLLDIFSNILKLNHNNTFAKTDDEIINISILGRNKSTNQPIRVRLAVNKSKSSVIGNPSNPIILGIHKDKDKLTFDSDNINEYIKISYYK